MKITTNFYTKPLAVLQTRQENSNTVSQNPIKNQEIRNFGYQDYMVSFTGRTPEDFYAQDFNRDNMPQTMKNYLFYDYEQRQHMPPEQMMQEVFKYIKGAKSLEQVKHDYPNERLFENLHEPTKKSRTGILSEIRMARELSDTPLLKDGSDDFGLYLLKKIYLEGKTLKEISKDFLEKDINDEYKGFITHPIGYETTSAYGIRFPKTDFWNSFIATREEYKKFFITLPKNTVDPNRTVSGSSHSTSGAKNASDDKSEEVNNKPRKFRMKTYQRKQLTNDIKDSDMTTGDIERKIRRRFKKDDPEASFIVKYLSPIMTVAADRVHLSEELKVFNEVEKINGKQGDETHMLKRFWKNNPELRTDFAKAITDTIELFEDNYGAGGMVPINNEFQPITSETKNQHIIDFVTPNFIDLIDQIKNLESERTARYQLHDELQSQWEQHFREKISQTDDTDDELAGVRELHPDFDPELLEKTAKEYGADVIYFKNKNGDDIAITANLDEAFRDYLNNYLKVLPSGYAKVLSRNIISQDVPEATKLTAIVQPFINEIDRGASKEAFGSVIKSDDLYFEDMINCLSEAYNSDLDASKSANVAMADTLVSLGVRDPKVYSMDAIEYLFAQSDDNAGDINTIIMQNKSKLDAAYNYYKRPLSPKDINKIALSFIDAIDKYDPDTSVAKQDIKAVLLMLRDMLHNDKRCRKLLKEVFQQSLSCYPYTKSVLNKDIPSSLKQPNFEQAIAPVIFDYLETNLLVQIINRETVNNYSYLLSDYTKGRFKEMERGLDIHQMTFYNARTAELNEKFEDNFKVRLK